MYEQTLPSKEDIQRAEPAQLFHITYKIVKCGLINNLDSTN